ncbi:hypothetical protein chiPu_0029595 [Chiloscyllium punctatum]|uniref:Uncharacterized protein n=1 Tax=Chiloscyllium punctatum TaxID=137246 RepID=A0A401TT18_CHIPU|nr:hypothetical protein [Chiloscyllium punctatum]
MQSMRSVTLVRTQTDMELFSPAAAAIGFRKRCSEPVCGSPRWEKRAERIHKSRIKVKKKTRKRPTRPG